MRASLRATTAILASLALVVPTMLPAQVATPAGEQCADGTEPPCATGLIEQLQKWSGLSDAQPAEESQADTGAEPSGDDATTDAPSGTEPADQGAAPPEAASGVTPPVEVAPEAEPEATATTDTPPEAEAEADAMAPADTPSEAEAETKSPADETTSPADSVTGSDSGAAAETGTPDVATEVTPTEPPEALAAENDTSTDTGEMETETVTEETARSSDEDFDGQINAEAGAEVDDSGGGLSKFEKALLLGAGALAVGAVVRGNRQVVGTSQDRVVVSRSDGVLEVLKDDNALLRQPGSEIQTRSYDDGSTRTITNRVDGSQVITVRDADLRVIRRILVRQDGSEVVLIDDTIRYEPVNVSTLPAPAQDIRAIAGQTDLRAALARQDALGRQFSLSQIRQINEVRKLAPAIDVETITFETGSAAIKPEQARSLADLGRAMVQMIEQNPNEVFLVEGHTDAVGAAGTNLILSDRRAESLALALTEYFDVPPENLVVQGYGESDLRIQTETAERANRRAGVRRITDLMQVAAR